MFTKRQEIKDYVAKLKPIKEQRMLECIENKTEGFLCPFCNDTLVPRETMWSSTCLGLLEVNQRYFQLSI